MLSNCKKLVQVMDKKRAPDWKERTLMADMSSLQQMGLDCWLIFVSGVILKLCMVVSCFSYKKANLLLLADDGTWCKCYLWLMPFLNGIKKKKKKPSMKHDFEEICLHKKITLRLFSSLLCPSSFFSI